MTRWCKLVALAVGWSGVSGALALAQDAPPPPQPSRWSLFHRDKATAVPVAATAVAAPAEPPVVAADDGQIGIPQYPGPVGPPPTVPRQDPGAPPPPPFGKAVTPPAVAPPGPDRPANGFSDPIPPDAENGLEPCPEPKCEPYKPYFFGLDYIHWWIQKQPVPALVTTGNVSDAIPGAFGQPHTQFDIDDVSHGGGHDGFRIMAGYDFDQQGILGVDASYFWLNRTSPSAQVSGDGSNNSMVFTRPFFNVNTKAWDADPINIPGVMGGTFTVNAPLRLMGAEANFRWLVNPSPLNGPRLTLLFGVNYLNLDEKLLINEDLFDSPGLGAGGNKYFLSENFTTYNRFYGAQFGAAYDCRVGPVVLAFVGKCAFGRTQEVLEVSGFTSVLEASGAIATNPHAALYVGPGNVGRFEANEFAVMPQGQFKVAYEFNEYFRLNLGYDVLWISRVVRPGNQINQAVNVQPIGGPALAPFDPMATPFKSSGLWAQGFNIGFEVNF